VDRVDLLGLADSGLAGPAGPGTLAGADPAEVADQVRQRIEDFRPHVVVTLDAGDGHRDHAAIRDATLAAAERSAWRVERVYLHCLPRSLMRRWLAHVVGSNPDSPYLDADGPGTPDELVTTIVDTARHLAEREQAIAQHASQVSPYEGLPAELRHAFLTADHLRRVAPAWTDGPQEHDVLPSNPT
jgi:LmbE family N-acetylglucosaminyl deacetylase